MSVSKKVRFEVFKRDGFKCQYCGKVPPDVMLEADHITPVSKGGQDEIENLITACFDCNRGKRDTPLSSLPETIEIKMHILEQKIIQVQQYEKFRKKLQKLKDGEIEQLETEFGYYFLDNQKSQVKRFVSMAGYDAVVEAFQIMNAQKGYASPYTKFKYFCGIMWNKIKGENRHVKSSS